MQVTMRLFKTVQVGQLDESTLKVLTAVSERDMSRSELLAGLGLTNETRNARRHLDPLLEAGLIEWTVPDRPNSRLQRYRITDAGRTRLNNPPGPESCLPVSLRRCW